MSESGDFNEHNDLNTCFKKTDYYIVFDFFYLIIV